MFGKIQKWFGWLHFVIPRDLSSISIISQSQKHFAHPLNLETLNWHHLVCINYHNPTQKHRKIEFPILIVDLQISQYDFNFFFAGQREFNYPSECKFLLSYWYYCFDGGLFGDWNMRTWFQRQMQIYSVLWFIFDCLQGFQNGFWMEIKVRKSPIERTER